MPRWKADIQTDQDLSAWQDKVHHLGGNIFHTPAWMRTKLGDGGRMVCVTVTDAASAPVAATVARAVVSRWPFLSWLDRRLILEAPPLVKDGDVACTLDAIDAIRTVARRRGYVELDIRPFTSALPAETLRTAGFEATPRWELVIDLQADEEDLWNRLRSGHKYNIKQARKHQLQVTAETSPEAFLNLLRLQQTSQDRARDRGNGYDLGDEAIYRHMAGVLGKQGLGRVYCVSDGSEVLAAALITVFNQQAYYTLAGARPAGYKLGAPAALIWEALLALKAEGVSSLNLGGVPGDAEDPASAMHGVYRFKTGFGGHLVDSTGGVCVLHAGRYRLARAIRHGIQLLMKLRG